MAEILDAHHHLWRYSQAGYRWISDEMQALRRDFLPPYLIGEMSSAGIDGAVAVQARQSLEETRLLLEWAAETPALLGVVGWVPLSSPDLPAVLRELCSHPRLKGVRHVVQDEPDDDFILNAGFNRGVAALLDTGLAYDILIQERHLPQALTFAERHPRQRFVLDHLAKPKIAARELEPWRSNLMRLADCPNVYCKVSGLVTEADWTSWSEDDLLPYLDAALEAFGPERLMAGSDWPVCLLATSYERWWRTLFDWAGKLTQTQQDAFLGGNARAFYRLESPSSSIHPTGSFATFAARRTT